MAETKVKINLRVVGDSFDPDIITKLINIQPDIKWEKGDEYIKNGKLNQRTYSNWMITTGYCETLDVDELMSSFSCRFRDRIVELNSCKKRFGLEYVCEVVVKIENAQPPSLYWNTNSLRLLDSIGADLDIDLYVMS